MTIPMLLRHVIAQAVLPRLEREMEKEQAAQPTEQPKQAISDETDMTWLEAFQRPDTL